MASIKFSRKEFEKQIKITKEIEEKISLFGTHLESLTKDEVELEILPNRPDLFSFQGFIRAFKAFLGKNPGLNKYRVNKSGYKLMVDKSLPKEWPFAVACIVKGLKFDNEKIKEVIDIQEKLGVTICRRRKKGGIGLYPLEKISFPVTIKGLNPNEIKFRPLEYPEPITGSQILQKHPTGREYAHIVEGWKNLPIFIDKKGVIMSMPPIINSHDVGKIDESTKEVFIEATGPDLNTIKKAITIIATSLAEMGGKIYSIECIQQDKSKEEIPNLSPEIMKISLDNVNKLLGLKLKELDLEKLLPKMGYDYKKPNVLIPSWRSDILHEVDIIEDIAIAYGYENLVPQISSVATIGEELKESKIERKIAKILSGLGILETSTFHLIKQEEAKPIKEEQRIEVENSKTDYKILRNNLLVPSLRILSENKDNEYPQKIFEIGKVFALDKTSETGIAERTNLSVSLSPSNFTDIKQVLDYLFKSLGINYELKEASHTGMVDGRTGTILVNSVEIGYLGEIHPQTLNDWNIKIPISTLEINLDEIIKLL